MREGTWKKDKQSVREAYVKHIEGYELTVGVSGTEEWWLNIYFKKKRWKFGPMTSKAFAMEAAVHRLREVKLGQWPSVAWSKSRGYFQPPKFSAALAGSK